MSTYERIVAAVDFSPPSEEAARKALELARLLGGRVEFLHVIDSRYVDMAMGHLVEDPQVERDRLQKIAEKRLHELLDPLDTGGVETVRTVRQGVPAEEVVKHVEDTGAHLVVIGTHGRTGLQRAVLGSQAELVVRRCTVPVLVVHAPHRPEE